MAKTDERKSIRCSFCGKPQSLVERLIAGNGAYICDECVKLCMSIVDEDYVPKENNAGKSQPMPELVQERLPKPAEIKANLDEYVIGQEEAKRSSPWPYTTTTSASSTQARPTWSCKRAISSS